MILTSTPNQTPTLAATPPSNVVQVAVPVPLDRVFDYAVPDALADATAVGSRVLVPFGGRHVTGVVVSEHPASTSGDAVKLIADVLDDEPVVSGEIIALAEWIADYYFCGMGEALRAALPAGIEVESERRARAVDELPRDAPQLSRAANQLLEHVRQHEDGVSVAHLRRHVVGFSSARLQTLERHGLVSISTHVRRPRVRVREERAVSFAEGIDDPTAVVESLRGERQRTIVETLVGMRADGDYPASRGELLRLASSSASSLSSLVKKGILTEELREVQRHRHGAVSARSQPKPLALHDEQAAALTAIRASIDQGSYGTFLLHGITGSGKTEVYIQALKEVLDQGRSGIVLVPEISLTPQTVSRFTTHFGDDVAVLHSRMAPGERYDSWRHIQAGHHRVVIGPRSAVLAPVANLGLIVVDEEHEQSYKQFEPTPRYHARDVAVVRASLNDAVCVLGSATPSLESYANAKAGKYTMLAMHSRAPTAGEQEVVLPQVHVIDLTKEKKRNRLEGILSGQLRSAIAERLRKEEQVILLQNRRGYAPTVECTACGWAPVCPDCSVTMTYHKSGRSIRCHYCGRTERQPRTCGACGSSALLNIGVGTQRVEEELTSLFPEARVLRMDYDTTAGRNAHHGILERFGRGRADILLGTQMVAKGLDFDRVTLVGVVDADTGLLFPDFRAEERTFQLLTQVAGRAGRGERTGEVFLQTRNAGAPAITFSIAHDYEGFAEYALRARHALSYPPFGRIVAVYIRGPEERGVRVLADSWAEALWTAEPGLTVLGPHPAFIARVRNQYRYVALVKVPRKFGHDRLRSALRKAGEVKVPHRYHVVVDIDAMGLF